MSRSTNLLSAQLLPSVRRPTRKAGSTMIQTGQNGAMTSLTATRTKERTHGAGSGLTNGASSLTTTKSDTEDFE